MAALAACLIFWLLLKDFTACTKNDSESPAISQPTTADGLNVSYTLLADKPVPLKVEDSKLVPSRANESTKNETKPVPTDTCQRTTFTTADGVNVTSVTLAINLVPSKLEDSRLRPRQAKEVLKAYTKYSLQRKARLKASVDKPKEMIAALGSTETIYSLGDTGLFSAVLKAYNNHWKLRTSPDDWWFCVIKRVASAIDKNAKKESVRKMFVHHKGKKTIKVRVPDATIYTVDYSWFFDKIAKKIQKNVKVPEFVDGMTADFSTTTAVQKIVSQITLMSSVQEYFDYKMLIVFCGIPAVDMLGTEDDWSKLKSKLKVLRTLLEPIENDLGLTSEWWDLVEKVFSKLLDTYQGRPDGKWWSHIISYDYPFGSGPRVLQYRGWITEFLEGTKHPKEIKGMTTGLVSVPLIIKDQLHGVQDTATLVAGMLGFTIHTDDTKEVSVQPFQGWSLLLSKDSPFL
ncbi:hypothetical protein OS493_007285 [Desmophyllum pertusum]|uniref:Uncharacterized protein n=1 Tax=Desmophyllum pertusum TaxID=174260 RepID=A0A9W9Z356_9CNID|nr:hypothetical protein OS493_007285 [Desmophyllum pertusum]